MDSRYVNIVESYGSDGLGNPSVSIYFSHCDRKEILGEFCKNCHNKELQSDGSGVLLTESKIIKLLESKLAEVKNTFGKCSLVLLGGEPTSHLNIEMTKNISNYFFGKYEIIMYTWKLKEELKEYDIKNIDKIVCGAYVESLKVDDYLLATSNQYIINNKKEIILKYNRSDIQ